MMNENTADLSTYEQKTLKTKTKTFIHLNSLSYSLALETKDKSKISSLMKGNGIRKDTQAMWKHTIIHYMEHFLNSALRIQMFEMLPARYIHLDWFHVQTDTRLRL